MAQTPAPERPLPFPDTGAGRRLRIVRIQREEHNLLDAGGEERIDRLVGHRMPVPHGDHHPDVKIGAQRPFQGRGLPPCQIQNRRPFADPCVVLLHAGGAAPRNGPRQRAPEEKCQREVDDIGIAKQVVEKRFHRRKRIGASELQEHDAHRFVRSHAAPLLRCQGNRVPCERRGQGRRSGTASGQTTSPPWPASGAHARPRNSRWRVWRALADSAP